MELTINNVSKQFKDKCAVNGITLELTPGVWGLLGANGAGKTTLMRMITGIMKPTDGQIAYDGVPIMTLKEQYRDVLGYLPQEFGFYPEFTVKEYLEYVAVLKGLPAKMGKRRIGALLEKLSLSDVTNKKISKLSGGMKRRVGIAQALLNDPQILILDEPTSMQIDPESVDGYYTACDERIASLMRIEQREHPAAQAAGVAMFSKVEKPFTFYAGINGEALDYQALLGFLIMLFYVWQILAIRTVKIVRGQTKLNSKVCPLSWLSGLALAGLKRPILNEYV